MFFSNSFPLFLPLRETDLFSDPNAIKLLIKRKLKKDV